MSCAAIISSCSPCRSHAASDVTAYNFSTKDHAPAPARTEPPAIAPAPVYRAVSAVNPVPADKEVAPKLAPLEKEIVYQSNDLEKLFVTRGALYTDPDVTVYINAVAARLLAGAGVSPGIEVHFKLIRDPTVNAFAFGNGSIYIHTGALARIENEAQLSFLLAHELSHYLNKDIVYAREDYHNKTVAYKVADVILAPSSVFFGVLGDAAQIGSNVLYVTSVLGYSRDIEARADKDAMMWLTRQGYDPDRAAGLMQVFMDETQKYSRGIEIFFLMNHPSNRYRLQALQKLIGETYGSGPRPGDVKRDEFLRAMTRIKLYNASLNIKLDRLEHASDNIAWVLAQYPDSAEAHYLDGEIYRIGAANPRAYRYELSSAGWQELDKRLKKEDLAAAWNAKAKEAYEASIAHDAAYANAYKGLGMLYADQKDPQAAAYLEKYLALAPDAPDKRYVKSVIRNVQPQKGAGS